MTTNVSNIGSNYLDYMSTVTENTDQTNLNQQLNIDPSNATETELMDACKQFEAYFLEQMFKEMEKTIPKSEESDSSNSSLLDYFKGNMLQEIAATSTDSQSLGLAQTLFEQMKRNYDL